jgi:hypothetical protein
MTHKRLGKGLALCSSLFLASCFVAYRQNHAGTADGPALMPGSKNPHSVKLVDRPSTGPQGTKNSTPSSREGKTVFPSSKSIDVIVRPGDMPTQPVTRNSIDAILNFRNEDAGNGTTVDGIPDEVLKPAAEPKSGDPP